MQLLGFHFDGEEAVEFEVILSAYESGSQHHVLELNKCVGSSSSSSGGLLLGKLLQLLVAQLRAQGFKAQRHAEQSSSGVSRLLSVPAEGTSAAVRAYSASTGLDLVRREGAAPPEAAAHSGSDMLSSLSKPGMDTTMLQDWSSRAARLPRWRSTEDVLAPPPSAQGTFQQRRSDAALTPVTDDDTPSTSSVPRGFMFQAMRGMRSQDSIPCAAAGSPATAAANANGIRRSVSASTTLLPSAAGQAADSPSLWAPIRSMLVHGPAAQREEAVRVLASLSANPTTHASIIRAKLPTLLARMLGLHSPAPAGDTSSADAAKCSSGSDSHKREQADSAAETPDPGTDAAATPPSGTPLSALPERLSRVGRALALAMVENLSKSAVGLECMKQNGMLAAVQKLLTPADAQKGSFDLQPGADILFSDLQGEGGPEGVDEWVALSLSTADGEVSQAHKAPAPTRAKGVEGGTEPPCPDVATATHASRLGAVLSRTRSALGTITQEAASNAGLLKKHMSAARNMLFSAFAASKLRGVTDQAEGGATAEAATKRATTVLPHVPAQDEKAPPGPAPRGVRWSVVAAAPDPLPAAPVRPPLRPESSVGSVGSDGGIDARAAAIEAELATLPRAPAEPVVATGGTPSPAKHRRGSASSDRSPAAVLA